MSGQLVLRLAAATLIAAVTYWLMRLGNETGGHDSDRWSELAAAAMFGLVVVVTAL